MSLRRTNTVWHVFKLKTNAESVAALRTFCNWNAKMSSFQKRRSTPLLPGAKQSLHNGQQLLSTGNSALDHIIGGGLPIGSILLIEEDKMVRYSEYLTKFYLSEGIVHNHALFLANLETNPCDVLKKLPEIVKDESSKTSSTEPASTVNPNADMRIAWRYNNLEKIDSEQGADRQTDGKNNYYFDLSKQIAQERLDQLNVTTFTETASTIPAVGDAHPLFTNEIFSSLLTSLKNKLNADEFGLDTTTSPKNLMRVSIQSLGSPLWWNENFSADLCLFLTLLKSLVRHSLAVCCITIPTHLFKHFDEQLIHRIRNLVDYSIELESFAGSDKEANAVFKEYHGLLYIRKLAALNVMAVHIPETYDLAFKLRRKRFVIEKLHLPPELQESEQREQDDDSNILSAMGCGSASKHLLEF